VSGATLKFVWGTERSDKPKQLKRLRQKIHKHKNSETHGICQKIKCKDETKVLESAVYESLKNDKTKTPRIFRTAYNIVKKG
jgi:hypothetical protein